MAKYTFLQFFWDKFRPVPPVVKEYLSGKNVLVTGANSGIGLETAKHFASMNPAHLYLGCRDEAKGQQAIEGVLSSLLTSDNSSHKLDSNCERDGVS
jgi:retinol dehydrogenase 12